MKNVGGQRNLNRKLVGEGWTGVGVGTSEVTAASEHYTASKTFQPGVSRAGGWNIYRKEETIIGICQE